MENFIRELAKANGRDLNIPTSNVLVKEICYTNLMEDYIPVSNEKSYRYRTANGFDFSNAFMYEVKQRHEDGNIYVLDGTEVWFNANRQDPTAELRRTATLFNAMYRIKKLSRADKIILDNPWLSASYNLYSASRFPLITNSVTEVDSMIRDEISHSISSNFITRGNWGLDYVFRYTDDGYPSEEELILNSNIKLITSGEYIRRISI